MTREQIALVRHSVADFRFDFQCIAMRFYARLFALDSSLHLLFPPALSEIAKVSAMLIFIIREAGAPERVFPYIAELCEHYSCSADNSRRYTAIGEALLWALEKETGGRCTPEVRDAWKAMFAASAEKIYAMPQHTAMAA